MKEIKLTQGYVVFVDDLDFERVNQYKWQVLICNNNRFYGRRTVLINGKRKTILLHRFILGYHGKKDIDHIDKNTSNNKRNNLRICTRSENLRNSYSRKSSSQYKGVSFNRATKKWMAGIMYNYKSKYLGVFKNENEAAMAYNKAAFALHGEFANINMI